MNFAFVLYFFFAVYGLDKETNLVDENGLKAVDYRTR
jgi:hypothetical protein